MSAVYYFKLLLPTGKTRTGLARIPVERDRSAKLWLEKLNDAVVLNLYRLPPVLSSIYGLLSGFSRTRIKQQAMSGLLRDLAVMTSSGIAFFDAAQSIASDTTPGSDPQAARVCTLLLEEIQSGGTVTSAFARQPEVFPETVRSLALIGDETGSMGAMLMEASSHVDRIIAMKSDIKQAMIYPIFSFATILGAGAFWIIYVVPNLVSLFKQLNAKLPPFTVAFLATASWLNENFFTAVAIAVAIAIGLTLLWKKNITVRRKGYALAHRLPISRTLLTSGGLAFFSEYLAILVRAGVDLAGSLRILEAATKDLYYKDRVGAMRDFVQRGDRISVAMKQVGGFPPLLVRMISVGEDSGTLDRQLSYLSAEYASRLKRTVETIAEIVKPLVILIAGALFLVLIVALLLPIYDLVKQTMAPR